MLFSVFPLVILFVSVLGLVLRDPSTRADVLDFLARNVPVSASGRADLEKLVNSISSGLSAIGLVSLVGLAWSASGMMGALRHALNAAWDLEEGRSFVRGKAFDLLLVLLFGLLVAVSAGLTIAVGFARQQGGALADSLGPLGSGAVLAGYLLPVLASLFLSTVTCALAYRFVPAANPRLATVWVGAIIAGAGFVVLQNGFAVYLAHFGNYNRVYGSLGAVIASLFFVYLSSLVLLFGAEVASDWERA